MATRIVQSAMQISSSILQVLVIESRWTDKAYNHGLAWHSDSPNRSTGVPGAISDYSWPTDVRYLFYVWNAMYCLHTTVQGCYFASTSHLSTIYRSLYLSGTIDHCGIPGGIPGGILHASLRTLFTRAFTRHLVLSCSIVYTACSNI